MYASYQSLRGAAITAGKRNSFPRAMSTISPFPPAQFPKKKDLPLTSLTAVSPVDGRYGRKTRALRHYMSEFALIRKRVEVEVRWVQLLCGGERFDVLGNGKHSADASSSSKSGVVKELPLLSKEASKELTAIMDNFTLEDAERVKEIEKTTNHDVKAVEYFLREKAEKSPLLKDFSQVFHFTCTSEDINNLSYCLMMRGARDKVLLPAMDEIIVVLAQMAVEFGGKPMLARTHGQPATPTTLGKELANFSFRLAHHRHSVATQAIPGKMNGAVGNYAAHIIAMPEVDWPKVCQTFVTRDLGLSLNPYTTQIEPHDGLAELMHAFMRFNTALLDLNRDLWQYVSMGYLVQKPVPGEVGSSTMPHKVNPIDFENSEGNVGIANALFSHFAQKLPVSRLQRDLSDSTVLRAIGTAFAHSLIAYESTLKGLRRVTVGEATLANDLNSHWEVLAEPVQTVLRRYNVASAYELLKDATQGKTTFDKEAYLKLVKELGIPDAAAAKRLLDLTPAQYTGLSKQMAERLVDDYLPQAAFLDPVVQEPAQEAAAEEAASGAPAAVVTETKVSDEKNKKQ